MPEVWQTHFASAQQYTGTPIVIGEIGGRYADEDQVWQDWAIPYAAQMGFGLFYFALNPDSKDTGGLVPDDWSEPQPGTLEAMKLEALAKLPSTDVFGLCGRCRDCAYANSTRSEACSGGASYGTGAMAMDFLGPLGEDMPPRHSRSIHPCGRRCGPGLCCLCVRCAHTRSCTSVSVGMPVWVFLCVVAAP